MLTKDEDQGGHTLSTRVGARLLSRGPPGRPPVPIFGYMKSFALEKIRRKLSGRSATVSRRNLGRTNLGLRRSSSVGETSL